LRASEHVFHPFTVQGESWLDGVKAKQSVELLCQVANPAGPVRYDQTHTDPRWLELSILVQLKGRAKVAECSTILHLDEHRLNCAFLLYFGLIKSSSVLKSEKDDCTFVFLGRFIWLGAETEVTTRV
jgi:hypothetical protein